MNATRMYGWHGLILALFCIHSRNVFTGCLLMDHNQPDGAWILILWLH